MSKLAFGLDPKDKALGLGRRVVSVQPVLDRLAQEEARIKRMARQRE